MNAELLQLDRLLRERAGRRAALPAVLGFDGTVDHLYAVVDRRDGPGDRWLPIPDIGALGARISAFAGRSANLELVPRMRKIGGNGPIMSAALAAAGLPVDCIGPLGEPAIDEAFAAFAKQVRVHSVGRPAATHALEFGDGKIMLAVIRSYDEVDAPRLMKSPGSEAMIAMIGRARLVGLLNWTCLPYMDGILDLHLRELLPAVGEDRGRVFFFDLADPAKHAAESVAAVLGRIAGFERFGRAVLGLNHSEACQVARALGMDEPAEERQALMECAARLRERLGITLVMIHPRDFAVAASAEESARADGPVCATPLVTTGAGDHLNAGFCLGLLLEFPLHQCLHLGVLFSGYYVRRGNSPSIEDILDFIPHAHD
jgi:sugar/nucleoside kinase (ribokinase family)